MKDCFIVIPANAGIQLDEVFVKWTRQFHRVPAPAYSLRGHACAGMTGVSNEQRM